MDAGKRKAVLATLTVGALAFAGCAEDGQVHIANNAEATVDVWLSDDDAEEDIPADGGVLIFTNECFDGPLVVMYADGRTLELAGPICPGQELIVGNEAAVLREASSTT